MKFGELIEYNMKKKITQKSYIKCCEEIIPMSFSTKSKLDIYIDHVLDQQSEVSFSSFLLYAKLRTIKIY